MPTRAWDMLRRHEAMNLKPYFDPMGFLTIGIGRNLSANGISEGEALLLFGNDVQKATEEAKKYPWFLSLNDARQDAIVDMVFNLGPKLSAFRRMTAAIQSGDFKTASIEMLQSDWAKQVGGRADELAFMVREGRYQE